MAATYVGLATCKGCHEAPYNAWRGSHHDLAMQEASDKSVLGNFANAKFSYAGIASTFFKRDGKFFVNTDGPDGKLTDYEIKYTFGVYAAAAIPDRVSRWPASGAVNRLGRAPEAGRRPALVSPLSQRADHSRRRAALDAVRRKTGTSCAPTVTQPNCEKITIRRQPIPDAVG